RLLTRAHGAPLIIHDRIDVALAVGADGVHLPVRGLPPKIAHRLCGDRLFVGASTHSLVELGMAVRAGVGYVSFGPVYPTPSKAIYGPPLGIERLKQAVEMSPVPVFALGGIDVARATACRLVGAHLACIGAVLGQADLDQLMANAKALSAL